MPEVFLVDALILVYLVGKKSEAARRFFILRLTLGSIISMAMMGTIYEILGQAILAVSVLILITGSSKRWKMIISISLYVLCWLTILVGGVLTHIHQANILAEEAYQQIIKGNYTGALEKVEKSLEILPDDDELWLLKGVAQFNLGQHKKALESYDKSLKLNPKSGQAMAYKGALLRKLGKHVEARKYLKKAAELDPQYKDF